MRRSSVQGRENGSLGERIPIPVVIDYDLIQYFWDKIQNKSILEDLEASTNSHSDEEKNYEKMVSELFEHEITEPFRGSLQIKYRTYLGGI
jgi:hypothetical protein